ncbi:uncharacterized protein [Drosophila pseudoobscura]|uniref:Uncharacterized protein n=1 Tax=Drosophila pseudoobscura pseudoobscura TaxID=46245 RepID=A0A6I8VNT7_DROPS|nr:uncharacterized protein LOC117183254 [Drosophila pseudoobscura]
MGLGLGHGHGHGLSVGATSPTTSVASASLIGAHCSAVGSGAMAAAPLGNICNTLPHAPSSNVPLNRNLVMLRNHLRKNTSGSSNSGGGGGGSGGVQQLLQDQDDKDQ